MIDILDGLNLSCNCYCKIDQEKFFEVAQLISNNRHKYGAMLRATGRKRQPHIVSRPRQLYAWMLSVLPENVKLCGTAEQCYWLLHGLIDFPKCIICGKPLSSRNFHGLRKGYKRFCSQACLSKDPNYLMQLSKSYSNAVSNDPLFNAKRAKKSWKTRKRRYGSYMSQASIERGRATRQHHIYENPNYWSDIYEKEKQTNVLNGHPPTWNNHEQAKQTRFERYNGEWESQQTKMLKKQHSLEKYGVDDPNKSPIVKQHKAQAFEQKYGKGIKTTFQTPQFKAHMKEINEQRKQKELETKRKNKTFSTSKPEEECFHILHFIYPRLIRQHRSEKYPFACDFYDPYSDTYFEFNGSWTHGKHWFDASNEEDQKTLQKWRDKGTKYYANAIATWTIRDVEKRKTAVKNNLKYVVFWNISEVREYVLNYK